LLASKPLSLFTLTVAAVINETAQWKRLEEHTNSVKQTHLKNLMQDRDRCFALMAEHKGILLDYSRQNMLPETMVRFWHHLPSACCTVVNTTECIMLQDMLFDLAGAAGLEEKRNKMATGHHVNATEDRAGQFSISRNFNISIISGSHLCAMQLCTSPSVPRETNSSSWTARMWCRMSTMCWTR
jgi:hypothetical protein